MPNVLFIVPHRLNRTPGQRFRFEQYLDYLKQHDFHCDISPLLSASDDNILYSPKNFHKKAGIAIKTFLKRSLDACKLRQYEIIFIFREAYMMGPVFFEWIFNRSRAKIIFDFDDAIWLSDVSDANRALYWLKRPDKTERIIELSDMIFAGNGYLKDYASQFNSNVKVVPTTIDCAKYDRHTIVKRESQDGVCIGWSGSMTTIRHFEYAVPFLKEIKKKYQDHVYFKVIGDASYRNLELGIQGVPWHEPSEIHDLLEIDIGIMPLPNDAWARGKCGLKGLQYMALEIPSIMSPVGVNADIIQDGENGYLASDNAAWVDKLATLVESETLRRTLGRSGRETVIQCYSVEANKEKYVQYFNDVLDL